MEERLSIYIEDTPDRIVSEWLLFMSGKSGVRGKTAEVLGVLVLMSLKKRHLGQDPCITPEDRKACIAASGLSVNAFNRQVGELKAKNAVRRTEKGLELAVWALPREKLEINFKLA